MIQFDSHDFGVQTCEFSRGVVTGIIRPNGEGVHPPHSWGELHGLEDGSWKNQAGIPIHGEPHEIFSWDL